jgi:conjugative transfer signal peptidase TraF
MQIRNDLPLYIGGASILILLGLRVIAGVCPPLILNLSASMPRGVYRLAPLGPLQADKVIVFNLPSAAAALISGRTWLREGTPLIKPIAALPGDKVCASGGTLRINGVVRGNIFKSDYAGKPLPTLLGCFSVSVDHVFVLSRHTARSYDSRYFGEIPLDTVLGQAVPVLTWQRQ